MRGRVALRFAEIAPARDHLAVAHDDGAERKVGAPRFLDGDPHETLVVLRRQHSIGGEGFWREGLRRERRAGEPGQHEAAGRTVTGAIRARVQRMHARSSPWPVDTANEQRSRLSFSDSEASWPILTLFLFSANSLFASMGARKGTPHASSFAGSQSSECGLSPAPCSIFSENSNAPPAAAIPPPARASRYAAAIADASARRSLLPRSAPQPDPGSRVDRVHGHGSRRNAHRRA